MGATGQTGGAALREPRDYAEKVAQITDGFNDGRIFFEPVGEKRLGDVSLEQALERLLAVSASG